MTFYEACAWLARAVDEDPATFGPLRRFTTPELIALERQLGHRLPAQCHPSAGPTCARRLERQLGHRLPAQRDG
jgi:hypothetical protein